MSTYLVVKYNNSNKSYTAKDNIPNKPYINISNKYFPLTTETSGTGIKLKINNNIYKIIESYTTTINTTYKSDYTIKQTGTVSFRLAMTPASNTKASSRITINIVGHRVPRKFSFNYDFSTTFKNSWYTEARTYTFTMTVPAADGNYNSACEAALTNHEFKWTIIGTTNDSASYASKSLSARSVSAFDLVVMTDTTASTVNSTRQDNTTTTTTSQ